MATPSYIADGMPQLMPYITVKDIEASLKFYQTSFGFIPAENPLADGNTLVHAEMSFHDARIMLGRQGAMQNNSVTPKHSQIQHGIGLYVYCPDIQAHYEQAKAAGTEIIMEPTLMFWGDEMYSAVDIDGYHWSFGENKEAFDPKKVPPGYNVK
ncbi:VOC family protein [Endozoicomonas sp. SM1973]|uniref:VOC family protein n=1 Tax=Spartinivicinus marinus TaxID=2994442 RepID=A0A853I9J9_9GAMM|nr:VOC family protein [Spartinivicinus marinus]MCX4025224.1 VOC family protein [Spartinivicinus marinus]NYZ65945.1 VOC family protein [Spartinivicinus marinus]